MFKKKKDKWKRIESTNKPKQTFLIAFQQRHQSNLIWNKKKLKQNF